MPIKIYPPSPPPYWDIIIIIHWFFLKAPSLKGTVHVFYIETTEHSLAEEYGFLEAFFFFFQSLWLLRSIYGVTDRLDYGVPLQLLLKHFEPIRDAIKTSVAVTGIKEMTKKKS